MWKKLLLPIFLILFSLSFINFTSATIMTDCSYITTSGYYTIPYNIEATIGNIFGTDCFTIRADNVTFDLGSFQIVNDNSSVVIGINVVGSRNVTIKDGEIIGFLNSSGGGLGTGISVSSSGINPPSGIEINNIRIVNSTQCLFMNNVTNSSVTNFACDTPNQKLGIFVRLVSNSTFSVFSRSYLLSAWFINISHSKIIGTFDTNVIIQVNETNIVGNFFSYITAGLIPATITGTSTVQKQSSGVGLMVYNATFNDFYQINSFGIVQSIIVDQYSNNNTFGKISLKGQETAGSGLLNGALWLGRNTVNNTICERNGNIIDDCDQLVIVQSNPFNLGDTCPQKNNIYYKDCSYVYYFNNAVINPTPQSISNLMLTPLIPSLKHPQYAFVQFLTTPLFLSICVIFGISLFLAKKTENVKFGLYTFIILVGIIGTFGISIWFSLVFVILVGYILFRQTGVKNEEN